MTYQRLLTPLPYKENGNKDKRKKAKRDKWKQYRLAFIESSDYGLDSSLRVWLGISFFFSLFASMKFDFDWA